MPLKWKIYYWCSLHLLLYATLLFFNSCFNLLTEGVNAEKIINFALGLVFLVALSAKAELSIKGVHHYKNGRLFSKTGRIFFIIGFCVFGGFTLFGIWFSISSVILVDFSNKQNLESFSSRRYFIMDCLFLMAVVSSTVLAIFDLMLLKAIRKKYNDSIESIGQHIQP
jgi:hypothetical protein